MPVLRTSLCNLKSMGVHFIHFIGYWERCRRGIDQPRVETHEVAGGEALG